jgi:hypothetical protein
VVLDPQYLIDAASCVIRDFDMHPSGLVHFSLDSVVLGDHLVITLMITAASQE